LARTPYRDSRRSHSQCQPCLVARRFCRSDASRDAHVSQPCRRARWPGGSV